MEANEYDTNRVDSDVLLPPRKRLLAGLKRQSSESASQSSPESQIHSPAPMSESDSRLQNLLKAYKNGPHMSPEELAKAAETAAVAATKAAEAARAAADEKAVIAAKAITAAKDALSLVASFSKNPGSKKNKMKKHVPVQLLYKEQQQQQQQQRTAEKCGTDEELAQKLHRAINSSPRSKNKHKKHRHSLEAESNGLVADDMLDELNSEGSYEGESSNSKEKVIEPLDGVHSNGRKKGRIKQKKLSLSLCSSKDRANPKDELNQAPSSVSIEPAPTWKCQDFKAPQCIKPNKVVQS